MALTAFPFDGGGGGSVSEAQWNKMARLWIPTGVVKGFSTELGVYADSTGRQVKVRPGKAFIEGTYFESDSEVILPVTANTSGSARIDRVVVRVDWTGNSAALVVVVGTPGATPVAPALVRTTASWDISLAQVAVANGAATIAPSSVIDERSDGTLCGYSDSRVAGICCLSTAPPPTWPKGGLVFFLDSNTPAVNSGSDAAPVWTAISLYGHTHAAGTATDAATLGGFAPTTNPTPSTIPVRNGAGVLSAALLSTAATDEGPTMPIRFAGQNGDLTIRWYVPGVFATAGHNHTSVPYASTAGDAATLGGHPAANSSGAVALNNGVVNPNLNADMVDSHHWETLTYRQVGPGTTIANDTDFALVMGSGVLYLPNVNGLPAGRRLAVKSWDNVTCSLTPQTGNTIDGVTTPLVLGPHDSYTLIALGDNATWVVV